MGEITTKWLRAIPNPARKKDGRGPDFLSPEATANVRRIHRGLDCYQPTPLVRLDGMAKALGVKAVFVKDESHRFGLKAFKGLGGIYALTCVVCRELGLDPETTTFADLQSPALREQVSRMVFVTTTDGNHGKGVAWAAGQLGCEAHVYMPKGSSRLRAQAIREAGRAEVVITDLCYDDAVRYAARMATEKGWHLVQDTSWEGYEEIPKRIIQGYTTMAAEAAGQLAEAGFDRPTHVLLQAGVGAMAGGVLGYLAGRWEGRRPVFGIVEPEEVACIYRSAQLADGDPHAATGSGETIYGGAQLRGALHRHLAHPAGSGRLVLFLSGLHRRLRNAAAGRPGAGGRADHFRGERRRYHRPAEPAVSQGGVPGAGGAGGARQGIGGPAV